MNTIVLQKTYDLYRQISRHTANFPKLPRYGIGLKLDNILLSLLENIISAEQTVLVLKDKSLLEANIKAEIAKIFLRLAMEE